jgi:2-polyprenyl-3-methyl-5-hydroxy-6-metoxy-1,4-benzoquinol methylase
MSYEYLDDFRDDIYRMIPPDGQVVGSIGCGRAATEARLAKDGRTVHGVDVSAQAIETAATRLTTARVITTYDRQPFGVHALDGLILADVLEHLTDAPQALTAFSNMVKPGGWVVVSVPNMRAIEVLWQFVVRGDWPEYPMGIFDATHVQVMTHKRLLRWAAAAGLTFDCWFDSYDFRFWRRNIYRGLDYVTLRQLRSFFEFEVQARFRKAPEANFVKA